MFIQTLFWHTAQTRIHEIENYKEIANIIRINLETQWIFSERSKSDQFRLKFSRSDDTNPQSFTNALQIVEEEKCYVLIGWTRKTKIKKVKCF